jgi:hypothetical protein
MALCCKMGNSVRDARLYEWFVPMFGEFLDTHGEEYRASDPDNGESIGTMARKFNQRLRATRNAGTVSG